MNHLPVLPIVIPLACAALMLMFERHGMTAQRILAWTGMASIALSVLLLLGPANAGEITVYLLGNWPAHLGIALVVDRLTVLMLTATTLLAGCALLYASSGSDKRAPHFHALFQLQLAGLNGAFLTGDLFNLFVFFEMLLIASYGLLLSGGKGLRMRAGLHYVAFNITASLLFLVALGLLYGLTGTLNMAEMAYRVAQMPPADAGLIRAAGLLLLVVFCSKAALLPLYFWLPQTYMRAPAAVAALFAIMTKVGVYAVVRVFTLVFGTDAGVASNLAIAWLMPAAAITLVLSALGALAARSLRTLAAYLIIGSAATVFIATALNNAPAFAAGLYYLLHSSLVGAALFLIADLVGQQRAGTGDSLHRLSTMHHAALLGTLYVLAAMSVAGMPPLSGFIGKLSLLASMNSAQAAWLWPVILLSSLLVLLALARAGSYVFWRRPEPAQAAPVEPTPALAGLEIAGTGILLALGILLAVAAAPVLRFTTATAAQLADPAQYREAVRTAQPLPPAKGIRQ
jgi:multicomponent K+:H+ antiporter subunit D